MNSLWIPGWHPTPLNKLLESHWAVAARLKAKDREAIHAAAYAAGLTDRNKPLVKRRVDLHLVLAKGQRAVDPDASWKSVLDALVACEQLMNDSHRWCVQGRVDYSRSMTGLTGTLIVLEDLR